MLQSLVPTLLTLLAVLASSYAEFKFTDEEYDVYLRALDLAPEKRDDLYYGNFPDGFTWASATSAYQIEGSWNVDGKGVSIWDTYAHAGLAENGDTGDIACDSYVKYQEDIDNLAYLGVRQYRFSISWTRIQPTGEETEPNQFGIDYYNRLIDGLLAAGIDPVVTLYHWDLPQALEDKGGWQNDTLIINAFTNFARICFDNFGDRVKLWITLNEPWIVALLGYGYGNFPPNVNSPGVSLYIVGHNLIRAHAEVYHLYDDEYRATQGGQIGITLNTNWAEPLDRNNASSIDAAMRDIEFSLGWFANPVFINGDYPLAMKDRVDTKSEAQNLTESRLPVFTREEKERNFNTSDFFGLNHYTTSLVFDRVTPDFPPNYDDDKGTGQTIDPNWPTSGSSWLFGVPFGMRKLLNYIYDKYGRKAIIVTENGISDRNDSIADSHRTWYYENYINNVLKAIDLDGVNVIGYTAWSLMDNFEWDTGFSENFGLYQVDFNDPARPRTRKDSVDWYKNMVANNGFIPPAPTED